MQVCGRFAPSPTGDLHAGSIVTALGSYLFAKSAQGKWHVRIEDVDATREIPGVADRHLQQLALLGLQPDGEVVRQSERNALYQSALDELLAQGLAFECHCSRSELAAQGGIHRKCVASQTRPDPAWRLRVPDGCVIRFHDSVHGEQAEAVDEAVGDFVLKRSDGYWAYQLAVVVDDAAQQITEVVRGADLLESTARQIYLQQCLRLPTPGYAHLPLLLDDDNRKLSKSHESKAVSAENARRTLNFAWQILGQKPLNICVGADRKNWLESAIKAFDRSRIPLGPIHA